MALITAEEYFKLHRYVFNNWYSGYTLNKKEIPNGDGKIDADKKYAHIAMKYLSNHTGPDIDFMQDVFLRCLDRAKHHAVMLGIPEPLWPTYEYSALRILDYPPGVGGNPHTDFDLFTLNCFRNIPLPARFDFEGHTGEILEIIDGTKPLMHHIPPVENKHQYSAVFFAIPDHKAVLPSGVTVGYWIQERIVRSRKENY